MPTKKTAKKQAPVADKPKAKGRKPKTEKVDYSKRPKPKIDRLLTPESGQPKYDFDPAVPISSILRDASMNYRWLTETDRKKDLKTDKVRNIKASINQIGVQKPVVLVRDKELSDPYTFAPVGGFTRLDLAAECGLETVPALILPKDRSEYDASYLQMLAVTDNSQELSHEVDEGKTLKLLEGLYRECETSEAWDTWKKMATAITGHTDPDYILRKLRPYMNAPKPVRRYMEKGLLEWRGAEVFIKKTKKKGEIVSIEPTMTDTDAKKVLDDLNARHKAQVKKDQKGFKDRAGKLRPDAVRATVQGMAKDGKLDSYETKASDKRKTPVLSAPSKEAVQDCVTILAEGVVIKDAVRVGADPSKKRKSSKYMDGETTIGEEVDESLHDPALERAAGMCLSRAIDQANIEGGPSEVQRVKLTLLLRAYGHAFDKDEWRGEKSERKNEETGRTKTVKNSDILEDLVAEIASAEVIPAEDEEGNEAVIENPTTFDRVQGFLGLLEAAMNEEDLEIDAEDEDADDEE